MKKLKLDLDSLDVQSFASASTAGGRGTVRGNDVTSLDCGGPNTVIAHYCSPGSSPMDCADSADTCDDRCAVVTG
jgi:hypothetical protein